MTLCKVLLLVVAICQPAAAWLRYGNQRIDHALDPKHHPKLVVAGTITGVVSKEQDRHLEVSMDLQIDAVLQDAQDFSGKRLTLEVGSFIWPTVLVPRREGEFCLLILRRDTSHEPVTIQTVVPARKREYVPAADRDALLNVIIEELRAQLAKENLPARQYALIQQLSPIATAKVAGADLHQFLDDDNEWVRRSALAGLLYATEKPEYTEAVAKDIRSYLATHSTASTVRVPGTVGPWGKDRITEVNAHEALFSAYFFLRRFWSSEEIERGKSHVRLRRLIVSAMPDDSFRRWDYGIGPLAQIGTVQDAPALYGFYQDIVAGRRKTPFPTSHRQHLLMGLSRILDLGLSHWVESDFVKKEEGQHRTIREALLERRLITEENARVDNP